MLRIELLCDGCGASAGSGEVEVGPTAARRYAVRDAVLSLRDEAESRGWERERDGRWHCRTCRRIEREQCGRRVPSLAPRAEGQ